jgi:O-antigen/teichoic acid export membrane protein
VLAGFDRVVLEVVDGAEAAGRYGLAYLVADGALSLFAMALHYAVYPRITRLWEAGDLGRVRDTLRQAVDHFLILASVVIVAASIAGPQILSWIGGSHFEISSLALVMLLVGIALFRLGEFDAIGFHLAVDTSGLGRRFAIAGGICLPVSIALIVALGIDGAALSTLISYLIFWLCVRWRNPASDVAVYPVRNLVLVAAFTASAAVVAHALPLSVGVAAIALPATLLYVLPRL